MHYQHNHYAYAEFPHNIMHNDYVNFISIFNRNNFYIISWCPFLIIFEFYLCGSQVTLKDQPTGCELGPPQFNWTGPIHLLIRPCWNDLSGRVYMTILFHVVSTIYLVRKYNCFIFVQTIFYLILSYLNLLVNCLSSCRARHWRSM